MVCQKLNPGQKDDEKGLTLLLVHIISVRTRWKHVSLEEIHTKSLKGRLIGGDDLLCDGDMAVLAIHSSFSVTPNQWRNHPSLKVGHMPQLAAGNPDPHLLLLR